MMITSSSANGTPRSWLQIATAPKASTATPISFSDDEHGSRTATPCRRLVTKLAMTIAA